jgi:hypothetical protein
MAEELGPEIARAFEVNYMLEVFGPELVHMKYKLDWDDMQNIMAIRSAQAEVEDRKAPRGKKA